MLYILKTLKEFYKIYKYRYSINIALVLSLILVSLIYDILYFYAEDVDNMTVIDFIYFNTVTFSTVGYGDISPSTQFGRIISSIYITTSLGLFAAILGMISFAFGTIIYKKYRGEAVINGEYDFVLAGGYPEKMESLVTKLLNNDSSLHLLVICDYYTNLPEHFAKNSVSWINGNITDIDKLKMVNKGYNEKYIILAVDPINKDEDAFIKLAYDNIISINKNANILAEVVRNNLAGFSKENGIRYIQVSRASVIAKEAINSGHYKLFSSVFNNLTNGNQYNFTLDKALNWLEVCKKIIDENGTPIGYHDHTKDEWKFSPEKNLLLPIGTKIKYFARTNIFSNKLRTENLLILGYDEYKVNLLIKEYLADNRFKKSKITILTDKKVSHLHTKFLIEGEITNENILLSSNLDICKYENILILGDLKNPKSDDYNYLAYSIIREKAEDSKIIVEIIDDEFRNRLEDRIENSLNQFTDISQAGQLIQEFHDPGAIDLIENLSDDNLPENIYECEINNATSWKQIQKDFLENYKYPVGYLDIDTENEWIFEPDSVVIFKQNSKIKIKYLAKEA
jgi:voltage-gated potassium channel